MRRVPENGGGSRIAIIGAGVSGLAACKHFTQQGLEATVFEGKSGVGGVWRASYPTTHLQTPKNAYAYSDFPWPDSAPTFPSHHQVVDYMEKYATHFGLLERIRFNSQVVEVKRKIKSENAAKEGPGEEDSKRSFAADGDDQRESIGSDFMWEICVRKTVPGSTGSIGYVDERIEFDFLAICCGRFGDVARMPSFPASRGPDVFQGQVLHALHYSALDSQSLRQFLGGKKVVVVGFQKTSLDIACEVGAINQGVEDGQPCTMVFRRTHWMFPRSRQAFGLFPFACLFSTRLSEYWTPKPEQGLMQHVLQNIFKPVRFLIWKMLEYYLRIIVPVGRYGLVPEHSLFEDLSACILPQLPESLLEHLEKGRIVPKKTPYWCFYSNGVRLADGTEIEADIVIFCTGYDGEAKLKAILPKDCRDVLFEPEGLLTLYRGVIHPQIPKMGFLGYFEGLSSVHSAEMGAVWLAQLLQKKFSLPDVATMERERSNWLRHMKITTTFYERPCVAPMQIWHTDKLCQDMGTNFLRKRSWWQEIFSIYGNSDYRSL